MTRVESAATISNPSIDNKHDIRIFRVSNAGMHYLKYTMYQVGMLAMVEKPEIPKEEDFGLVAPMPEPGSFQTDDPAIIAYWEAIQAWLATVIIGPGIPMVKLIANDFWHVTGDETRSALRLLGEQVPSDEPVWQRWIEFLTSAARHDGFTVG